MRKLVVAFVVLAGFAGLIGVGAVTMLLSGGGGRAGWSSCSSSLGPWGDGAERGQRDAAKLSGESLGIVQRIIEIGQQRGLPPRAWQIAIQAGKTESNLANLYHGDRDSLGIFQMRPSMGWGTVQQVTDVDYQINKFYDVLLEVPGWEEMRPGTAAQKVERSAFPLRYHQWEPMAAHLVSAEGDISGITACDDLPSASVLGSQALQYAHAQLGKPYVWGAAGPDTFDCSGLTQQAWKAAGVEIPKYSQTQYFQGGVHIPLNQAQPGDLVFWGSGRDPKGIHHVALYLGDEKVLHAPQPGESVEIETLWDGGELLPMVVRPAADTPPQVAAVPAAGGEG
ncbi:Cell wall-associated hydrolases (invasion-associated proteins) [Saccharopolyspora kobensis]|uniref:Cell wall-associated hydrolases (Invasion-associated proteins) n=1 Tax=Saccharopolyspora kobensis TaxID=146035 RepID=A0A1H6E9X9_9PSEU|nr:C40 family peptidase [Saccharopolyspora kobensis]SEG93615.1 Cell wall-associated hydrolases (invasion-associated proteins) [Saccharopolyspora kobensis]SFD46562.1 NlpC/P60 family protein [Saccharopolyspora kobensis]